MFITKEVLDSIESETEDVELMREQFCRLPFLVTVVGVASNGGSLVLLRYGLLFIFWELLRVLFLR